MSSEAEKAHEAIRAFLATAGSPAVVEDGQLPIPLEAGFYDLEMNGGRLVLHAWDRERNLVRRIRGVASGGTPARLQVEVEKFGKKTGTLDLVDLRKPTARVVSKRAVRSVARETLRRSLLRQFAGWQVSEVSSEPDLENSLSATYPRAVVKRGTTAWAAMISAPEQDVDGILTFGLIWLDYLRRRERKMKIEGLALFLPEGKHRNTCLRLLYLNSQSANFKVFLYGEAFEDPVDLGDYGNVDSSLPPSPLRASAPDWLGPVVAEPGVETVTGPNGSFHFRVNGLEFARWDQGELKFGVETTARGGASNIAEIVGLARGLQRLRHADAADRTTSLFLRNPEAWLESRVRSEINAVDAGLLPSPIYGQVPAVLVGERGVIDLLACDFAGRLAVVELKVSEDLHLPLQALDYWIRVKWHLDHGGFEKKGFFPNISLVQTAPRMLLVCPVLNIHPTTEIILRYLRADIVVEQIGLAMDWARELKVVFRRQGGNNLPQERQ